MAEAPASQFASFLARALELLSVESPLHLAAARAAMHGISACITVAGEPSVRVQLDARPWVTPAAHAEVSATISRSDLIALLEGALTIERAVHDDRLRLQGALDPLLSFLDALFAWVHGAVRCPSFPALYRDYLALPDHAAQDGPVLSP